jgi:hypothetical protein
MNFWREIDAFKTSQKLSEGKPVYSFYDGPPFATGKPHYGHLLAGTIKVCSFRLDCALYLMQLLGHCHSSCALYRSPRRETFRMGHARSPCRA